MCLQQSKNEKVEITSGAYFRELPDIVPYEASLPIFFEIKLKPNVNCDYVQCFNNKSLICELKYKIESPGINISKWGVAEKILNSDGSLSGWDFQVISRDHVKNIFTNQYEYETFKSKIKSEPYHFKINEINLINKDNLSCDINSLVTLYAELKIKITNVISGCYNRKLHPEAVALNELQSVLESFKKIIAKHKRKVVINDEARYYTLPITECVVTAHNILIGLQIPLIREDIIKIKLRRLIPIPMAWKEQTCKMATTELDVAVMTLGSRLDQEILIPTCDPYKDQLCLLKNTYGDHIIGIVCAKKILQGTTSENLAKYCPYKCQTTGQDTKIITQLTTTNFFLTHERENFQIKCKNKTIEFNKTEKYGTLNIHLPCICKLIFKNEEISPEYPCLAREEGLSLKRVIPAAWLKLKQIVIPPYDENRFPQVEDIKESLIETAIMSDSPKASTENILLYTLYAVVIIGFTAIIIVYSYYRGCQNYSRNRIRPFIVSTDQRPASPPRRPINPPGLANTSRPATPTRRPSQGYMAPIVITNQNSNGSDTNYDRLGEAEYIDMAR